jgi:hypothetical protein
MGWDGQAPGSHLSSAVPSYETENQKIEIALWRVCPKLDCPGRAGRQRGHISNAGTGRRGGIAGGPMPWTLGDTLTKTIADLLAPAQLCWPNTSLDISQQQLKRLEGVWQR